MQSFRISTAAIIAVLLCAGFAPAQSLIASQGQTIAFHGVDNTPTGDVAPGLPNGERFGGNSGPSAGVIDNSGNVLWRAQLVDSLGVGYPTAQQYLSRGYFLGDSRGNVVKVLRGGDAEPSGTILGATLQSSTGGIALNGTPRIASNGLIMFAANIWDAGATITTSTDEVIYAGTPGNWQIVAREGSLAPGCAGANYSSAFASINYATTSINAAGQVLFQSALAGGGTVPANNIAWFTGTAGNIQLLLRKGDLALTGETVSNIGTIAGQMNASGQVLIEVTFAASAVPPVVTTANDKAIWIYTPGSGSTEIIREGNASPIAGTFYGSPSLAGPCVFNNAGKALLYVDLTGAVTVGTDDKALFLVSPTSNTVVLRRGDAAPGIPGASFLGLANFNMGLNDSGAVAFTSTVTGGGVTSANDSGLWTGTAGNLTLVAREGDVAPGSGGQTFGNFSGNVFLNAAGQVVFSNALSGGGSVTSYYSWDPVLGLQPLLFPADQVEVQPGILRTLSAISIAPNSNGDARLLLFANDGTVTFRTGFTDGSFGIVKIRTGSLTALPKKISNASGGTQSLWLQTGSAHAGQLYAIAGSASGTNPGTPIGAFIVPLNLDSYTDFTLANANVGPYMNTLGNLDANGRGLAHITVPPGLGLTGIVVNHAYGVLDAFNNLVFVSEPASLEIIP